MLAWRVESLAAGAELELKQVDVPTPVGDQCLVRVEAAGVNFLDILMIRGKYQVKPTLPFTPGIELVGTVVQPGPSSPFAVKERVCAIVESGAFAEFALLPRAASERVPSGVPVADAVALPVIYPTAYVSLQHRAGIRAQETVLVNSGAGGVGSAAIQLARHWGARVIATASTAEKRALCREIGADVTLDASSGGLVEEIRRATQNRGVDVVVDPVGGKAALDALRCLAWGGRLVIVGFTSGEIPKLPMNQLLLKNASALGVYWGEYRLHHPDVAEKVMSDIFHLYLTEKIKPIVTTYRFEEAAGALRDLSERRTTGKVVLLCPS